MAKTPLANLSRVVRQLEDYKWSSCQAFVGSTSAPDWLELNLTKQLIHAQDPIAGYRQFVMKGSAEETIAFHQKGNMRAVFGSDTFKEWVFDELLPDLEDEQKSRVLRPNFHIDTVFDAVSNHYQVSVPYICKKPCGKQAKNEPRKVAMYLCQELTGATLFEIATFFNLKHYRSASFVTHQVRVRKREDETFGQRVQGLIKTMVAKHN